MHLRKLLLVSICFFVIVELSQAHQKHEKTTQTTPSTQTAVTQTEPSQQSVPVATGSPAPEEPEKLPPMKEMLLHHMHNKIIHFPLAFGLAGVLFVWLTPKWPQFDASAKLMWMLAALSAVGAYFTGKAQEEPFRNSFLWETVEIHEKLGISTGLSLWLGLLLLMTPKLKRYARIWAIVLLLLISAAGFLGGVIAHTE